jgi:hypothetical protein
MSGSTFTNIAYITVIGGIIAAIIAALVKIFAKSEPESNPMYADYSQYQYIDPSMM